MIRREQHQFLAKIARSISTGDHKYVLYILLVILFLVSFLYKSYTIGNLLPNELLGPDPYKAYIWFVEFTKGVFPFPDCYQYVPLCLKSYSMPLFFLYPLLFYIFPQITLFFYLIVSFFVPQHFNYSLINLAPLIANPVLFGLSTLFLYFALKRLFRNGWYAIIFAFLPSLMFRDVAGRFEKEPIATFFFTLSFLLYVYFITEKSNKLEKILIAIFLGVTIALSTLSWGGTKIWLVFLSTAEFLRILFFGNELAMLLVIISFFVSYLPIALFFKIPVNSVISSLFNLPYIFFYTIFGGLNILEWLLSKFNIIDKLSQYIDRISKFAKERIIRKNILARLVIFSIPVIGIVPLGLKYINRSFYNRFATSVAENQITSFGDWVSTFHPIGLTIIFLSFILSASDIIELILIMLFYFTVLYNFSRIAGFVSFGLWLLYYIYRAISKEKEIDIKKIILVSGAFLFTVGDLMIRLVFFTSFVIPFYFSYAIEKLSSYLETYVPKYIKKQDYIEYLKLIISILSLAILVYPLTKLGFGIFPSAQFYLVPIVFFVLLLAYTRLSWKSVIATLLIALSGWVYNVIPFHGDFEWIGFSKYLQKLPKDALITHWWDYGYYSQFFANNWFDNPKNWTDRVTFLDGMNAISYWDHLFGRYVLGTFNETTALELEFAHANFSPKVKKELKEWFNYSTPYNYTGTRPTYLYIDPTDIGKSFQFTRLGSNENFDILTTVSPFRVAEIKGDTLVIATDFPNDDPKFGTKCIWDINRNLYCDHVIRAVIQFNQSLYKSNSTLITRYSYITGQKLADPRFGIIDPLVGIQGRKITYININNFEYAKPINGTVYIARVFLTPDGKIAAEKPREIPLRCVYIFNKKYILNPNGYGCVYFAPTVDAQSRALGLPVRGFTKPLPINWLFGGWFMNYAEKMLWGKLYFFDNATHFKLVYEYADVNTDLKNDISLLLKYNIHGLTLEFQPRKLYKVIYPENFTIPDWKRCIFLARNAQDILRCIEIFNITLPKEKLELLKQGNYYVI